ncbi:MAG: D-aminoacylase [Acidobacteriota bacterium]
MIRRQLLACLLPILLSSLSAQTVRTVIRQASIVDGSGQPAFSADLAFQDGRIIAVGQVEPRPGDRVIAARRGRVLAPGFIDIHNHSQQGLLEKPQAESQVSQGIATLVVGADGGGPFPPAAYRKRLAQKGTAVNVALLVGHGRLRRMAMGNDYKRPAKPEEVEVMKALLRLAFQQGVFGLSSGLEYDPGFYSQTDELVELAREAASWGGFYMSHIRDEEDGFIQALDEAIEIGRRARIPVQISHIKLGNTRVWGRTEEVFQKMAWAAAEGVDVLADCYPYNAWASSLSILVPSRRFDDRQEVAEAFEKIGGAHNVLVTRYSPDPSFEFKNLTQIAQERKISEIDLFMEMMDKGGAGIVGHSMNPQDVERFYRHPRVMVASDGGIDSRHPRMSGTFPRVLGRFVRQNGWFSLEEAIRKMTSMPAARLGLNERGLIRTGFRADLTLFDPGKIIDHSDFQNPDRLSEGVELVLVNGVAVWEKGRATGQLPGAQLVAN